MKNSAGAGECFDVLIVGAGPAGLNAAQVLGRSQRTVALCDGGESRNAPAVEMHGFLSRDGYSPRTIERLARRELRKYESVRLIEGAVAGIERDAAAFVATMRDGRRLFAARILLATGMRDELPPIEGIEERWGHSVFVCPHCDGWEFRDRKIGVYGEPGDVVGLAQELSRWSRDLTLFGAGTAPVDAKQRAWLERSGARVAGDPRALEGERGKLSAVLCADGTRIDCDVLFLCVPLVQRSSLASELGCERDESGAVCIDESHHTSAPGIFACGDMVTRVHQVIVAAASGVKAAIAIDEELLDAEIETVAAIGDDSTLDRGS